ncbi:MAG: hypothetical protein JWM44_2981 [Bacilli bacterium]|nr:hypothetical protein [Bacilli bacterium]
MRVAIDVVPIRITGEIGGAFLLVVELIKGLARFSKEDKYFLLTAEWNHQYFEQFEQYGIERICVHSAIKLTKPIKYDLISKIKRKLYKKIKGISKRILKKIDYSKYSILRANSIDVLFCPMSAINYSEPGIPTLSLIHDIQHEYYPQFFSNEEIAVRQTFYNGICNQADYVVCVSKFTQQTLVEKLNYPVEKSGVIYNSIQDRLNDINSVQKNEILEKFGLKEKRYIYYPANYWPHKNHRILLVAMSILIKKYPELDLYLCLTGSLLKQDAAFDEMLLQMNLKDRVHHLGYVTDQEVSGLMAGTSLLVFPSLFEGFGIPVAEAMSLGIPVICSNNTSLPEVGGDAVLYFDPRKPEEIAEMTYSVMTNVSLRNNLIKQGYEQIKKFDNEIMVKQYYETLQNVANIQTSKKYMVNGVYGDNWTKNEVEVSLSHELKERILYLEMILPSISPHKHCQANVLINGKKKKYSLKANQMLIIKENLPREACDVSIIVQSTFSPKDIGIPDDRELGVKLLKLDICDKLSGEIIKTLHGA